MQKEKISIIIPVYQVKEYLCQCIDSVLNQTYQNIEVILVDDGSTDGSGEVCDSYMEKDQRVKVIHKPNGGLVSARKMGIQSAEGDYIGYVDSDDWVDETMYENLYRNMVENNADMVICAHTEEYDGKTEVVKNHVGQGVFFGETLVSDFYACMLYEPSISKWGVSPACWDKLFKKNLIYHLQMEVDERIWDGEDHAFIYPAMLNAKCISIIDDALYHHRIRSGSVATGYDSRCFERFSYLFNGLKEKFEKSLYWDILKDSFPYEMRWFLFKHIYSELGISCVDERSYFPSCLFPFEKVEKGAKIVIYGAGVIGQLYYKQIAHSGYCEIVAWVDRNYQKSPYRQMLMAPTKLHDMKGYEVVVIAVEDEIVASSIKTDLQELDICKDKILWKCPRIKNWEVI